MKLNSLLAGALLLACTAAFGQTKTGYVDPFIGTDGMGHTFPGACVPFGGVQLSPDTDTIPHNINGKYQPKVYETCAGYAETGIRQKLLLTIWSDSKISGKECKG